MEKIEKIFIVPILERFIEMNTTAGSRYFRACIVKGLPLVLYSSQPIAQDMDLESLANYLVGQKSDVLYIDADSESAAIDGIKEFVNYGGDIGAIWFDGSRPLIEIDCPRMYRNGNGRLICGPEVGCDGNGEFGMCRLEKYDKRAFCPSNVP